MGRRPSKEVKKNYSESTKVVVEQKKREQGALHSLPTYHQNLRQLEKQLESFLNTFINLLFHIYKNKVSIANASLVNLIN